MATPRRVEFIGIGGLPEIVAGDPITEMVVRRAAAQGTPLAENDILVVTQKVVSKSEGRMFALSSVTPSPQAADLAGRTRRDPRLVELILRESAAIVRVDETRGIIITETRHGFVCANSGIDSSNVPGEETVCLLPVDPDASARAIREDVCRLSGLESVAVVITDTFGRAWREGHVNFAIGVAGMDPFNDYRGAADALGKSLKVTRIAVADEVAAASELVMAKSDGVPAAIARGVPFRHADGSARGLLRDRTHDLFR
ncbi:MAG: coenzyme F420-0:L-glutamate ligase [SAR202 cluster bacterium]|nr:coenzyme F420-0:L-glutamate ligase [SAR202 cluster bacterium]